MRVGIVSTNSEHTKYEYMKNLIRLEEVALFGFGIFLYWLLDCSWWWFWGLLLAPDLFMLGYLIQDKFGAWMYNVAHHRAIAIGLLGAGWFSDSTVVLAVGIIFFSHIALDRAFGYGLKYEKGFKFTHLGKIGKP